MIWCMKRTNLYLDESQTEALDELARDQGISRAEVVRRLIDRSLGTATADLESDIAAIDESFGVLRDESEDGFPERGPGEREAELERLRRL